MFLNNIGIIRDLPNHNNHYRGGVTGQKEGFSGTARETFGIIRQSILSNQAYYESHVVYFRLRDFECAITRVVRGTYNTVAIVLDAF